MTKEKTMRVQQTILKMNGENKYENLRETSRTTHTHTHTFLRKKGMAGKRNGYMANFMQKYLKFY